MKHKRLSLLLAVALLLTASIGASAEDTPTAPDNDTVTSESALAAEEYGQANPAPVGTPQTVRHSTSLYEYEATVTINSVLRGEAAWEKIHAAIPYNAAPVGGLAGMEYILAHITVDVQYSRNYLHYFFNEWSFTLFSVDDIEYKNFQARPIIPGEVFRGDVFPGGTLSGYAVFLVSKTDPHPKVVIGGGYITRNGSWFSLG